MKTITAKSKTHKLRRSKEQAFLAELDKAIEFHRTNTNDPYGIAVAVMAALAEVRDAFKAAYISHS